MVKYKSLLLSDLILILQTNEYCCFKCFEKCYNIPKKLKRSKLHFKRM